MPSALDQLTGKASSGGANTALGALGGTSQPADSDFLSYIPGAQSALSVLAPALDFLSRGQYASAGFFDSLINDNAGIGDAFALAGQELLNPTRRKSFRDVISRANPEFANANPKTLAVLGFLGDVALDPTTYLGLGLGAATKGARIGGRALTTLGETFQSAARGTLAGRELTLGLPGAIGAAETLGREAVRKLPREIAEKASFGTAEAGASLFNKTTTAGIVEQAAGSIGKDLRAILGGKLPKGVTDDALDTLASQISLERLGIPNAEQAVNFVTRQADYAEILSTADQLVGRLAAISPELEKAIFKPGGLKLGVGIPLTRLQAEIPLINADILRAVGLDRLDGVVKAVAALPGIKQVLRGTEVVRGAFDRFYKLDPEYVQTIDKLQNEFDFIKYDVVRDSTELVKTVSKEGRERISRVMNAFQAGIERLDEVQRLEDAPRVFQMALRQAPLQPKEQAVVMSLIQGYGRAAELERAAMVAGQSAANFDPRVYQAISGNAEQAADWLRRAGPDGVDMAGIDPKLIGKGADLAAAIAEGADLGQDAVLLYAQRVIQARQKLPKLQAKQALEAIYGSSDPSVISKINPRVANDLRYFGEYRFPTFAGDESGQILGALDWLQRKFKASKTVINPGFAPKQALQNSIQSTLVMGNNAYRAFDPRAYSAAATILMGRKPALRTELPETAADWIAKFTDADQVELASGLAKGNLSKAEEALDLGRGLEITTPTGAKLSREEIELLARTNGIIRESTGFSGESLKRSLQDEIGLGKPENFAGKAFEATKALANGYLGLSSKVEDTSRLALFINGLTMGDSPVQAAQRVNRALFDYGRSFSRFETEVLKRLVPFYSFQRLALPLVLKTTLENPGSPATLNKVADTLGTLISGDKDGRPATLSQAEREIFGRSFLIEQPRVFKGFDANGGLLFNVFNNLTPFDVLSLFTVTKKNGEIDYQRTAEKTIGGMLTPFLKVPAELVANREFFTDKVISDARGGIGKLGRVKDTQLDAVIPDPIKALIGWEWGTDRRTGDQIAYVNPYLAYTVGQLAPPVARQFIKPLGDDESVLERAMRITLGIGEQSLDLKQSLEIQNAEDKRYLRDLRANIRTAQRQGRQDSLSEALDQYRTVLRAMASKGQSSLREEGGE